MTDGFVLYKYVRRFSKRVAVMKGENITLHFVEDEMYGNAYRKLLDFVDSSGKVGMNITVAYLDSEWITFMCKGEGWCLPLNYSLKSGFFERDKIILDSFGVKMSDIKRAIKRSESEGKYCKWCVYPIRDGVAVMLSKNGEKTVKIRH